MRTGETKIDNLLSYLAENGPATLNQIRAAGHAINGLTRERLLKSGAVEVFDGPNPDSSERYAKLIVHHYRIGQKQYVPPRRDSMVLDERRAMTARARDASRISGAIKFLEKHGYIVKPPTPPDSTSPASPA